MSPSHMPGPDDIFAGHRVVREIGRGGMGVVYLAEHLHLERKVALKLLPPDYAQDDSFRARFIRESKLAASLQHPSIVPIYDAGETDGLLFISMLYVEGSDLKQLIRREGALGPERTLNIIDQIASALDEAHDSGLVHRDVKPQNTLVAPSRRSERAYLTDFGLTKRYDSKTDMTATGMLVGTVDYMSPEQLNAETVDGRTDLYSLGCVLYECLTGRVPYERPTLTTAIAAHLTAPPPRVSEVRGDLPAMLDEVIMRALAKGRADRYATCSELVDAARKALTVQGEPSAAASVPRVDVTPRFPRPRDGAVPGETIVPPSARRENVAQQETAAPVAPPPRVAGRSGTQPASRRPLWLIVAFLIVVLVAGLVFMLTRAGDTAPSGRALTVGTGIAAVET